MIRKFMHLERSEYWEAGEASDADWLYSAIYDVDVITNKACFGDARDSPIMIFWTFCMFLCFDDKDGVFFLHLWHFCFL